MGAGDSCKASCSWLHVRGPGAGTHTAHLVVLAVHDKVQHDEVMAVAGGLHMEQEPVDEVLHEGPGDHAQHKQAWEHGLGHRHGIICSGAREMLRVGGCHVHLCLVALETLPHQG